MDKRAGCFFVSCVVVGVLCFVFTVPFVVLRCEVVAILSCVCKETRLLVRLGA